MSNRVYGYLTPLENTNPVHLRNCVEDTVRSRYVGCLWSTLNALTNFPDRLKPTELELDLIFEINDRVEVKGAPNTEYLVDGIDYHGQIGLPARGDDRIAILIGLLRDILSLSGVTKVTVAINECDEVEAVKSGSVDNFETMIWNDFAHYAPPNIIYVLKT